jgi:hypothetical protein
LDRLNTIAEVYLGDVDPQDWVVWALDPSGDGGIFATVFSGPYAERRAIEYARAKFREFRLDEVHLRRPLPCQNIVADAGR